MQRSLAYRIFCGQIAYVGEAQQQPLRVHPLGLFAEKTPENQLFYLDKIKHTEPTVDARMGNWAAGIATGGSRHGQECCCITGPPQAEA
jgi:hypothetical protein